MRKACQARQLELEKVDEPIVVTKLYSAVRVQLQAWPAGVVYNGWLRLHGHLRRRGFAEDVNLSDEDGSLDGMGLAGYF